MGGYGAITNGDTGTKLPVPEGTNVYMQWRSRTGATSPIYVTQTHDWGGTGSYDRGSYVFDLREGFYDNQGVHHVFGAYNDQFYRIWVEPQVNQNSGNMMYPLRAGDGIRAYERTAEGAGRSTGQWQTIGLNLQRVDRWMTELPIDVATGENYMVADNVVEMPYVGNRGGSATGKNRIEGRVWYESGQGADASNGIAGPSYEATRAGMDSPAGGYKVYLTTLTPEGVSGLQDIEQLDRKDRTRTVRERLLANPQWLETTYVATTAEDGTYSIDGIKSSGRDFRETTGNVYMWVEDPNGVIMQTASGFATPEFRNAAGAENWRPNPSTQRLIGAVINENFAIQSSPYDANLKLFIRNFDNHEFPAKPGSTAELVLDGTVPLWATKIVWTDSEGYVVDTNGVRVKDSRGRETKDVDAATGTPITTCGDEVNANFTVPAGAKDGETYTALLYSGAGVVASDSFVVTTGEAAKYEPRYESPVAPDPAGNPVTSDAPVFRREENGEPVGDPIPTNQVPVKRYEFGENPPAGATIDENTGRVTLPQSPSGTKNVKVPVVVVYEDNTRDLVFVEFEPVPTDADRFEPVYPGTAVNPEQENVSVTPQWRDANGEKIDTPTSQDGRTPQFSIDKSKLPKKDDGSPVFDNVTVDPATGVITIGKAPKKSGDYVIPVDVTYPDGSTETVDAEIRTTGTDPTKPDTDGDGVPDAPPSISKGDVADQVPSDGRRVVLDDLVKNPTPGLTGEVRDLDNNPIAGAVVEIDPSTGSIHVSVPEGSSPGDASVLIVDNNGEPIGDPIDIRIVEPERPSPEPAGESGENNLRANDEYQPVYVASWGRSGEEVTSAPPTFARTLSGFVFRRQPAPEGVTYEVVESDIEGATVAPDGRVTLTIPAGWSPRQEIKVRVKVTYADGTTGRTNAVFKAKARLAAEGYQPIYPQGQQAAPGESVEIPQTEASLPDGTEFSLADGPDLEGWRVSVDPATGLITATAPEKGGAERIVVPVKVSYWDGSSEVVEASVDKQKLDVDAFTYQPEYAQTVVDKTNAQSVSQTAEGLPEGTTYTLANDGGLDVGVNETTGELSVAAREDSTPAATHFVTVRVEYPDGSSELVITEFTVDSQARTDSSFWKTLAVPVRGIADGLQANPAPRNSTFAIAEGFDRTGWAVDIDHMTGRLTVATAGGVSVGETADIPVVVTFPDESQRVVMVRAVAVANPCDSASSQRSSGSSLSSIGSSAVAGSSRGGSSAVCAADSSSRIRWDIAGTVLGALTLIGGVALAIVANYEPIRNYLRQYGINI